MSIGNKLMMSSCLMIMSTVALAMNENSGIIPEDSSLQQVYAFSSYLSEYVSSGLDSLKMTVTNFVYDDAAFKKLGWPCTDDIAREELRKSTEIYVRVNNFLKENQNYPGYLDDCKAINRRTEYCQRVLIALNNNTITNDSDRVNVALHCLQHHKQVLNDFDKSKFLLLIKIDQEKIKNNTQKNDKQLADLTIVPEGNDLLNNLLEQTIHKKELEKQKLLENQKKSKK